MSCRILGSDRLDLARPVLWPSRGLEGHAEAVHPAHTQAKTDVEPAPDPEVLARLHNEIRDLHTKLEVQSRSARELGVREGEAKGRAAAESEWQPVLERLAHSLHELATLRSRVRRETETELVQLSIAIARRVLHREISLDPEAVQGLVKAALDKAGARDVARVRLHPAIEESVRHYLQRIGGPALELSSDPTLQPGGLVVETKRGDLDASVETQLMEIQRGFADRLAH